MGEEMSDIWVFPGRMFVIRPSHVGLSSVATWQMVPATDDCPTVASEGGGLVVNPQKPGAYHGIAISDGKPVTFSVVCEAEQGGASFASKAWGKVKGAASVVGPVAKPLAKYGAMLALGAALTLAPRGCEILDWFKPGPNPPGPVDPPKPPAPIVADGLHVLIVYESADLQKLPPGQLSALKSQTVRDYLDGRCAKENGVAAWRIWDADVDTKESSKAWQDAMKRPRASLPWIVISDGKSGFEGPLPGTVDATLELLKKWGNP
jgi:hypothetical protein